VVSALQAAGANVEVIHKPVDLLVGGINSKGEKKMMLVEVKVPGGTRTKYQKGLFERWEGYPLVLVDGPEAALRMYRVLIA
jgi:hypothetical protein